MTSQLIIEESGTINLTPAQQLSFAHHLARRAAGADPEIIHRLGTHRRSDGTWQELIQQPQPEENNQ